MQNDECANSYSKEQEQGKQGCEAFCDNGGNSCSFQDDVTCLNLIIPSSKRKLLASGRAVRLHSRGTRIGRDVVKLSELCPNIRQSVPQATSKAERLNDEFPVEMAHNIRTS